MGFVYVVIVFWGGLGVFGVFQRTGYNLSLNNYSELNRLLQSSKRVSLVSVNNLQICHIKDSKNLLLTFDGLTHKISHEFEAMNYTIKEAKVLSRCFLKTKKNKHVCIFKRTTCSLPYA